jgi:putative PIN family toxin of toxin-antitoxin system
MEARLVLDTSVVVAAVRSRIGASNLLLRRVARKQAILLLSPALLLEYEEVLKRAEHRLVHGLTEEQVDSFIAELAALAEPVDLHFSWRPQAADPSDEMVLETAINGKADAIVTFEHGDGVASACQLLRARQPGRS